MVKFTPNALLEDIAELDKLVFANSQAKLNQELHSFVEHFEKESISSEELAKSYVALTGCHPKLNTSMEETQQLLEQLLTTIQHEKQSPSLQQEYEEYQKDKDKRKRMALEELRRESDRLDEYYARRTRDSIHQHLVGTQQWL
ncbi:unnamed protein product [Rhizopus microsporus]